MLGCHPCTMSFDRLIICRIRPPTCEPQDLTCLVHPSLTPVWCFAANSTGMVGYDFGAQSAFVSVGADTDVSGKEVQARWEMLCMRPAHLPHMQG